MKNGHPRAWIDCIEMAVCGNERSKIAPNHELAITLMSAALKNGIVYSPYFYQAWKDSEWSNFFSSDIGKKVETPVGKLNMFDIDITDQSVMNARNFVKEQVHDVMANTIGYWTTDMPVKPSKEELFQRLEVVEEALGRIRMEKIEASKHTKRKKSSKKQTDALQEFLPFIGYIKTIDAKLTMSMSGGALDHEGDGNIKHKGAKDFKDAETLVNKLYQIEKVEKEKIETARLANIALKKQQAEWKKQFEKQQKEQEKKDRAQVAKNANVQEDEQPVPIPSSKKKGIKLIPKTLKKLVKAPFGKKK